jgi:hypothetical protein
MRQNHVFLSASKFNLYLLFKGVDYLKYDNCNNQGISAKPR